MHIVHCSGWSSTWWRTVHCPQPVQCPGSVSAKRHLDNAVMRGSQGLDSLPQSVSQPSSIHSVPSPSKIPGHSAKAHGRWAHRRLHSLTPLGWAVLPSAPTLLHHSPQPFITSPSRSSTSSFPHLHSHLHLHFSCLHFAHTLRTHTRTLNRTFAPPTPDPVPP